MIIIIIINVIIIIIISIVLSIPQGGQQFGPCSVMALIPPSSLRILTGTLSHVSG